MLRPTTHDTNRSALDDLREAPRFGAQRDRVIGACILALGFAWGAPEADGLLAPFEVADLRCGAEVRHCFGLNVFVVVDEAGKPAFPADRFRALVAETARHFGPLGIGFEVRRVSRLPAADAVLATRKSRTALGAHLTSLGQVPVFLVRELQDVDQPGEIRGVHWRDPGRKGWSWVVLGTAEPGSTRTLTHELGHFFGLPHGRDPASLMNKSWRASPLPHTWSFVPKEQAKIRRTLTRHLGSGKLRPLEPRSGSAAGGG
jgi:hypothetical protein